MKSAVRDSLDEIARGDAWLVIVAHPDDETFGCGSLIAAAASCGAEVTVLCATRGEAGERTPDVDPTADLGQIREAELHAAASGADTSGRRAGRDTSAVGRGTTAIPAGSR